MQISGDLTQKHCKPSEGAVKPLLPEEYESYLSQSLHGWKAIEEKEIERDYKFKDFQEALDFIARVGQIAEEENHHPDIFLHNWNKVKLTLSTHTIKGLSENDFIVAAKIDA